MDMENRKTVLICDNDEDLLQQLENALGNEGYDVDTINNASELIPRVIRFHPGVIVVNPDMQGFNADDVCNNIVKGMNIPIILLFDPHATSRAIIGECRADDEVVKPVAIDLLSNLLAKHITVNQ
jgi:DNA-binding response OmpR family regulator